jgi:L-ascorbate 6-phosphate lactonase
VTVPARTPIDDLLELPIGSRGVGLNWLGQAGFVLRAGGTTALIDPFLSPWEGRRYESALAPERAEGVDLVLCSHEHIDHFDASSVPAIASASPGAVVVVPTPIVDMVTEAGVAPDRVVGMQPGDDVELSGVRIRPVRAMHGVTMEDAYGFGEELSGGLVRFLGFVIDAGGVRLYHAGDTIAFDGMAPALRHLEIDVALLPINGRDTEREARGIVGNLSEGEAATLAADVDAGLLVPMHYDLFEGNLGHPTRVLDRVEADGLRVPLLVPVRERPFVVGARR